MNRYKRLLILSGFGLIVLANATLVFGFEKAFVVGFVIPAIAGIIIMFIGIVNYITIPTWLKILLVMIFTAISIIAQFYLMWGLLTDFKFTP